MICLHADPRFDPSRLPNTKVIVVRINKKGKSYDSGKEALWEKGEKKQKVVLTKLTTGPNQLLSKLWTIHISPTQPVSKPGRPIRKIRTHVNKTSSHLLGIKPQKMLPSKLLTPLNPIIKLHKKHPFPNPRFGFCKLTQTHKQQEDQETINEITSILNNNNQDYNDFISRIKSFQNPLNPNLIQSILAKNQSCDPKKLLHFFNWSVHEKGIVPNLVSFLILAMSFVSFNRLRYASNVLDQMIETRKPVSDVVEAVRGVGLSSLGFTQLVYAYKSKCMLDEAVFLLLSYGDKSCFVNSVCFNSLLSDLLKGGKMELFWKVCERLSECDVKRDVYTYSNVIKGYCMSGRMEDAKRVFLEMEEDGCSPNLVTYNLLIGGLCQYGLVDEAIGYKKAMVEKGVVPDAYSYSVIIDELCKRNRFSDAKLVLDGMNKAGLRPKTGTYSSLIFGFMREGKIEEALSSNDDMIDKNCEPGSALWSINNLMKDLLRLNKMESFWNVYEKMLAKNLEPNDFTYTNLIGGYVRVGKLDKAKHMFSEMGNKGYNLSLVTYNVLINGLCISGLVDEAFELKSAMARKGLKPDLYTYTSLIDGLCKLRRSHDAKLILEDMAYVGISLDNYTYTALIDGFLKQGEVDEAFKLKDEMVAKGISVNLVTFNCIINGLCKLGQYKEAIKIFEGMKEEGVSPDVFCYNSLILGICKAKRMEEARGFLTQMVENGVRPNAFTYGAIISAYNDIAEVKAANMYFEEMIGHGIVPDQVILASMIDGHCKEGNSTEALSALKNILGKSILPDVQIYNAFIQGFSKNQMMELAMKVYSEVRQKSMHLDVFAYTSLISGFIKQSDLPKAFELFDEMQQEDVRPNIVTYNNLINGLCKMGDVNKARELFDEIRGKGVMVNALTYATMIDGYCKSKNLAEAFRLLDDMSNSGIQADEYVYGSLVNGCCKEGDTEKGLLLFDKMVKSGFSSAPIFNTLIDGICKTGKAKEVNNVVKNMPGFTDLMFNDVTISTLIHHYCKSGMIKDAERLLMEMKTRKITPTIEAHTSLLHSYIKSGGKSKIFEDLIELDTSKNEVSSLLLDILSEEKSIKKSFELLNHLYVKELCSRSVFDGLVDMFCKKGKFSEALASVDELKKRGITLGFDSCKTLILGLKSGGYDDEVGGVFKKMVKCGWVPASTSLIELMSQEETDVKENEELLMVICREGSTVQMRKLRVCFVNIILGFYLGQSGLVVGPKNFGSPSDVTWRHLTLNYYIRGIYFYIQRGLRAYKLVLHQNQKQTDPNHLLHFFNCDLRLASGVLGKMIDTRYPVRDILDEIEVFCVENEGLRLKFRALLYGMVVDCYRNKGLLDEGVCVLLGVKCRDDFCVGIYFYIQRGHKVNKKTDENALLISHKMNGSYN
ncbi:tetratricopeptide-like helical domain-containing protein [Artemisia annua]|uniref:Tetratricopeptide-like helical domain-containing protein n=1 Tax=Artemisia annua TaxID=35608 RepID=A0A2U1MBH3_ARTAN|nr:tetratricopeptide-like helical domain-containing protein [Artemisia annua]